MGIQTGDYIDTLLGPERTCTVLHSTERLSGHEIAGFPRKAEGAKSRQRSCGVLFENCTVDASILYLQSNFVVSMQGHTVDALGPRADEGRRRLR